MKRFLLRAVIYGICYQCLVLLICNCFCIWPLLGITQTPLWETKFLDGFSLTNLLISGWVKMHGNHCAQSHCHVCLFALFILDGTWLESTLTKSKRNSCPFERRFCTIVAMNSEYNRRRLQIDFNHAFIWRWSSIKRRSKVESLPQIHFWCNL